MTISEVSSCKNLFPASISGIESIYPQAGRYIGVALKILKDSSPKHARSILSRQELEQWQSYTLSKRKDEYLTGRLAAKMATLQYLSRHQSLQPDLPSLEIQNQADGRPYVNSQAGPAFQGDISISHSGEFVTALAASRPCGIDIQEKQEKLARLRERFSYPIEENLLKDLFPSTDELDRLNLLWAAKEAVRKATSQTRLIGFLEMELINGRTTAEGAGWLQFQFNSKEALYRIDVFTTFFETSYVIAMSIREGGDNARASRS